MAHAGNPSIEGTEGGRRVINLKPTWFQVTKFQELQVKQYLRKQRQEGVATPVLVTC